MQTIKLAGGGLVLYDAAFLPHDLADRYLAELRDAAPWEQKKAAFGHLQPRLTASYADGGVTCPYLRDEEHGAPANADPAGDQAEGRGRQGPVQLLPFEPPSGRGRQLVSTHNVTG